MATNTRSWFHPRGLASRARFAWALGLALAGVLATVAPAAGQPVSPVQSAARPFGLSIVDKVRVPHRGDARSTAFVNDLLPHAGGWSSGSLTTPVQSGSWSTTLLDPAKLALQTAWDARAYFVSESASYRNSLGLNTRGRGVASGNPLLIFPDASTNGVNRKKNEPLLAGDFVSLGTLGAGATLDFFLIADGAVGGRTVFTSDAAANPDGLRHMTLHALQSNTLSSPYLMVTFEDLLGGGDGDFNDLVVVLDVGQANLQHLIKSIGAPEPSSGLLLVAFLGVGGLIARRRARRAAAPAPGASPTPGPSPTPGVS